MAAADHSLDQAAAQLRELLEREHGGQECGMPRLTPRSTRGAGEEQEVLSKRTLHSRSSRMYRTRSSQINRGELVMALRRCTRYELTTIRTEGDEDPQTMWRARSTRPARRRLRRSSNTDATPSWRATPAHRFTGYTSQLAHSGESVGRIPKLRKDFLIYCTVRAD